jgi:hypothetical protein
VGDVDDCVFVLMRMIVLLLLALGRALPIIVQVCKGPEATELIERCRRIEASRK